MRIIDQIGMPISSELSSDSKYEHSKNLKVSNNLDGMKSSELRYFSHNFDI